MSISNLCISGINWDGRRNEAAKAAAIDTCCGSCCAAGTSRDHDYTQPGAYFVTLCAWQRDCIFGEVAGGEVRLNQMGQVASDEWLRLARRFPQTDFPVFVIIPNHMHGIVVLHEHGRGTGEGIRRPDDQNPPLRPYDTRPYDGPHVVAGSLGAIVRAYKTSVTWHIHALDGYSRAPVWQRNYYEHIIRNDKELENIWLYIEHNPQQWEQDQLHPAALLNRFN